jgi:CRP-like cAMP-binding protein
LVCEDSHTLESNSQKSPLATRNVATAINFLSGASQGKYTRSNNEGYAAVTASPAFMSKLGNADLAAIAQRWSECSYQHNELIIAHGDSDRDVFFLLAGRARVTMFSEDGREIAYRDIAPGEIFGELLRRAEEIGSVNGQVSLSPAPTHFELAASISTHREAISREMSTLAKRGLIERRGRRLILHDLALLEGLASKKE